MTAQCKWYARRRFGSKNCNPPGVYHDSSVILSLTSAFSSRANAWYLILGPPIFFLAVISFLFWAYWWFSPVPGPTVENFKRLHKGMTRSQVVAILGPPDKNKSGPFAQQWGSFGTTMFRIKIFYITDKKGVSIVATGDMDIPRENKSFGFSEDKSFDVSDRPQVKTFIEKVREFVGL